MEFNVIILEDKNGKGDLEYGYGYGCYDENDGSKESI